MRRQTGRPTLPAPARLVALLVAMLVAFVAIGVRLFDLQGSGQTHFRALGLQQRVRTVTLAAERGSIFDRNGTDLALSIPQTTITADPRLVKDPSGVAATLAPIVGVDESSLALRLANRNSAFAYVARKVDDATAARVRALDLPGISFVSESKRFYPSGSLAGPLLGFVGTDNNGLAGLESLYDKSLSGKAGAVEVERDPQGRDIPGGERSVRAAERGTDLVLTIDRSMQYEVEQALVRGVTAANAKGGMAIVADVRTGDILAMATVDGAMNDHPAQAAPASENNRPVTDVYEPGSTNKVITMSGAIQEGLVTPSTLLDVPQQVEVDHQVYSDVETHPASMTVSDILAQSSNVGTIKIAGQLGRDRFDHYLRAFGFGSPTALQFPGEASGILLPVDRYNATSMASMPIGNGIAVTAMQMLDVYMTIANNGMARPPRLVEATVDADGARHEVPLLAPHQVVSADTASSVRGMLERVVQQGTGVKAAVTGYKVAGKTGTARKPPYDKPPFQYVASFAGFAPADSARLAAIVVLDAPQGQIFGGDVAAPVFRDIMQFGLGLERVPPSAS